MRRKSRPLYVSSVAPICRAQRAIKISLSSAGTFDRQLRSRSTIAVTIAAASIQSAKVGGRTGRSFTGLTRDFLPLNPEMVKEVERNVREIFDAMGGPLLLKSSRDVYLKPNVVGANAYVSKESRPASPESLAGTAAAGAGDFTGQSGVQSAAMTSHGGC